MKLSLKPCSDCKKESVIYKNYGRDKCCKTCAMKRDKPKPIPKESKRRKKERPIYTEQKNKALEERPLCELRIPGVCTKWAQGMQHKKGRVGDLYLDMTHKITSCNACNGWCEQYPLKAKELGLSEYRNRA